MKVIIGVDPHKASHHAVAVDEHELELGQLSVRASRLQTDRLLAWAAPFEQRTWPSKASTGSAICCPNNSSRPANASSMSRPHWPPGRWCWARDGRTRPTRTTPGPSRSPRYANRRLRHVAPVGHADVPRLLAKRNHDIGRLRNRVVSRLHSLLGELAPGGIAKEINASDVEPFLATVQPSTPSEQLRYELALEMLDDIRRLDAQLKASHQRIRTAVAASGTTLTEIYGIGRILAAGIIGHTGDITRFRDQDHFAAYNGTARSSTPRPDAPCVVCRGAGTGN